MMKNAKILHRTSKLFQPITATQNNIDDLHSDISSKSQRLMLDNGIIKQASPGNFHFLPLGVRALDKLIKVIDQEMTYINAQKLIFPTLVNTKLWKTSGRLDNSNELFKLKDRHSSEYLLSPTHEEVAANLINSLGIQSYKNYPLKLYQITPKFRDEIKPRFGLMRARQFLMKDLYSFDIDSKSALRTYEELKECYHKIFSRISVGQVKWVRVRGPSGTMGGDISHEYHFLSEIGEDKLLKCNDCQQVSSLEYLIQTNDHHDHLNLCSNTKCLSKNVQVINGIEVGHTFLLGDKYSKPLGSNYLATNGKPVPLHMGSYGIGLSRMLAATLEVLSTEMTLRWPHILAPYQVVIIGPKIGSKEEAGLLNKPESIYAHLNQVHNLQDDVLLDDRSDLTIGKRLLEAKRTGYPFVIVVGSKATQSPPLFEVISMYTGKTNFLNLDELIGFFTSKVTSLEQQVSL